VAVKTKDLAANLNVIGIITAQGLTINGAFTFPTADGSPGYVLTTDGAGNVTWQASIGAVTSVNSQTGVVVLDTDDISEGVTNLYFTDERVDDRVAALIQNGTGLSWTYNDGANTLTGNVGGLTVTEFSSPNISQWTNDAGYITSAPVTSVNSQTGVVVLDTDDISEGVTNLYWTQIRFDNAFALKSIFDLSDVIGSSPLSVGDILRYNGSDWVNEALPAGSSDELVKVSINDTTPGYLLSKVTATSGKIVLTEVNDGGDEDLNINIGADIFDKTVDDTGDITEGTNLFFTNERVDDRVAALIQNGTGLSWTYNDGAGTLTGDVQDNTTTQRLRISKTGALVGTRQEINFIEGGGVSITVADNAGSDRVDVTISASITEFLSLGDLNDVDTTGVQPGEVLTYSDTSPGEWVPTKPKRSWTWDVSSNGNNVTDSYLRGGGDAYTNQSGFRCAFACKITAISASNDGTETWTAEVRKNGSATVIASQSVAAASGDQTDGLSVSLAAGDVVEFYCNGTNISDPGITIWVEEE
jgi:hypothetical protein